MSDPTGAERQRRHRRHKAGDHSLCDPERCEEAVTPIVTASRWFRAGGRRLWDEMSGDGLSGSRRVLLEQACRIVDRLDRLEAILNGRDRSWLTLEIGDDGELTLSVDKLLGESRQQAIALKQILAELRQGDDAKPETGGGVLDQLAARRAARIANAPG